MSDETLYIYDPSKDSANKSATDRVTQKLNEYMQGYSPAGAILLELFDGFSYKLFNIFEQDLPELRGKWIEYVYKKFCMSIPWELKIGIESGKLIESLLADPEWTKAHKGFKKRIMAYRKAVEEQKLTNTPPVVEE